MLPGRVLNPGPLTYESGALPIALRGPAIEIEVYLNFLIYQSKFSGLYYYSRTIMARTGLGPSKKVPATDSSNHPGLVSIQIDI